MKHEPATVGRKVCKRCGEEKSVLAFAADSRAADGLQIECRSCHYELYNKVTYARKKQSGEIKSKSSRYGTW